MTKKRSLSLALAVLLASPLLLANSGCEPRQAPTSTRDEQARLSAEAANSVRFTGNAERDNIRHRLELTSNPGLIGYIVLLNEMGQPIMYEGVRGKVTSGSKRLTEPDRVERRDAGGPSYAFQVRQAPSDEGTYGSSNPYIFYWNTDGTYRQWDGRYLYSTQPIRLRQEPLVVSVTPPPPNSPVDVSPSARPQ